jgi:Regulator of chromosome condensation (RCC1) repeat
MRLYAILINDQGYYNTVDITDASKAKDVFLGTGVYATAISARCANTCAVLSNGKLLCWGSNEYGKPALTSTLITAFYYY